MEHTNENKGRIPRIKGVALVGKGLVVEGGDRETILIHAWHNSSKDELDGNEAPICDKGEFGGVGSLSTCQREAHGER